MQVKNVAIAVIAGAGAFAAGSGSLALAAVIDTPGSTSANWSGYVASGSSSFSTVRGSWIEPNADCSAGDGHAAFWVGVGGASQESGALEQVGTQVDCSSGGSGTHHAWYELVPAGPVKLPLAIEPGDHVSARVSVSGTSVTVSLTNQTTGASTTRTLQMDSPDVSSAEWIAEAPSLCQGAGASDTASCTPVPLANFGSMTFTGASAAANGNTGTISTGPWSAQPVQLDGSAGAGDPVGVDTTSSAGPASAAPSSLSPDGSSFSVTWQSSGSQSAGSSPDTGDANGGSGTADPYGDQRGGYWPVDPYGAADGYGYEPGSFG